MDYKKHIKNAYQKSKGDPTKLFQTVMGVVEKIGMDAALAVLEQCVSESWMSWLDNNLTKQEKTSTPITDASRILYEQYLRLSLEKDGDVVALTDETLVVRWRNNCPVLDACLELGMETSEICRKVYHKPVQDFLSRIDPRLRFERNYKTIRPYGPYCEERIALNK
jgi:hypothetical protein